MVRRRLWPDALALDWLNKAADIRRSDRHAVPGLAEHCFSSHEAASFLACLAKRQDPIQPVGLASQSGLGTVEMGQPMGHSWVSINVER